MKKDLLLKDFKAKGLELKKSAAIQAKGGYGSITHREWETDDPHSSTGWVSDCSTTQDGGPLIGMY